MHAKTIEVSNSLSTELKLDELLLLLLEELVTFGIIIILHLSLFHFRDSISKLNILRFQLLDSGLEFGILSITPHSLFLSRS